MGRRLARNAIEVMAVTCGVASFPVTAPLVLTANVLRSPARRATEWVTDGTTPFIGPPVARTLDRFQGYAAA